MATEIKVGTTPNDFPGYPTEESNANDEWVIVERYWVRDGAVANSLPAYNATTNQHGNTVTDRDGNTLNCRTRSIQASDAPGIKNIELTYARSEDSLTLKSPADNPREVSMIGEDIPIDDERLLVANGGIWTPDHVVAAKKAGYASLPLYGIEYTYTDIDASFAWTEAAIIASLQTTGSPSGMGSPSAGKWELIGKEISETNEETIISEKWRYAAAGVVPIKT
jgi:hypothetical protein